MRHRGPGLRSVTVLCCLLVVGSAGGVGTATARAAATSLETEVGHAITAQTGEAPTEGVHLVPVKRVGDWTFGTALIVDSREQEAAPEVTFFLARKQGDDWVAQVRPSPAFDRWLIDAPNALLAR